jgi:membrane protease YdiL (CAAX protease family)
MLKFILDNPEKTLFGKIRNIGFVFALELIYLSIIVFLLKQLDPFDLYTLMHQYSLPHVIDANAIGIFFFACIWAPLWEEAAFRYAPITIAKNFGPQFLFPVIIISSVLFGWGHGSGPVSLLIQGVGGFLFSLLYIKNGFSYKSSVTAHFLWNLSLMFLLPVLIAN